MNLISGDFDFFWKDITGFRRKQRNIHVRFSTLLKTYCLKCRKQKKHALLQCVLLMENTLRWYVGIIWQKVKSRRVTKNDTGVPNRQ